MPFVRLPRTRSLLVTTMCRSMAHLFAPGIGEIIGGTQREERLDVLDKRMDERRIDKEHYGW